MQAGMGVGPVICNVVGLTARLWVLIHTAMQLVEHTLQVWPRSFLPVPQSLAEQHFLGQQILQLSTMPVELRGVQDVPPVWLKCVSAELSLCIIPPSTCFS